MKEVCSRRERVLFDVVLGDGERVAELLPRPMASTFARVWNRLPRPRSDRAKVVPIRWREVIDTD